MQRRFGRVALVSAAVMVAATLMSVAPAGATHNADLHSENLTYQGTSVKQGITNSDLAFWGNRAYAGHYGGFRIIDISDPTAIENPANVLVDYNCPGPQNDISVWNNDGDPAADLLFLSVDSPRAGPQCGAGGVNASDPNSWEGVRIFNINDERNPTPIAMVPTDCGSHTHTLVPGQTVTASSTSGALYVYVSSYPLGAAAVTNDIPARDNPAPGPDFPAGVRNDGTECREPEGANTAVHNKISIIRVDLANPATADDAVPGPPPAGGGDPRGLTYPNVREVPLDGSTHWTHRTSAGRSFDFTGCHDISVYMAIDLAAAACWQEGQFWDISDPAAPHFLRRARNDAVSDLFHSATFTLDGRVVAFEDEAAGGGGDRCRDPEDLQGRMWFYNTSARLLGSFKIPRPQGTQVCTAHNYNVIPLTNGRYILVSAWYEGGTSIVDFTNPANATEIGFYDAQTPPNGQSQTRTATADTWSSYWYNGFIYANDGLLRAATAAEEVNVERGLDVFTFDDPVTATAQTLPFLNPQTQMELIAQTYQGTTRVTIRRVRGGFAGTVTSDRSECVAGRTVAVRRVRRGPDGLIGTTTTDADGVWQLTARRKPGRYYAVVRPSSVNQDTNMTACGAARSRTLTVR